MVRRDAYAVAGVDIARANETKLQLKELVRASHGDGVIGELGGFGGLFRPPWTEYDDPILVSSVDSVGSKLKIAFASGIHDTVGMDIVFHCANDILVQGARPLFFMDYLGLGSHDPEVVKALVGGVSRGCGEIGCSLIGGETAELPEFYNEGEYDLAGSIVGIVESAKIIDGSAIEAGDQLIGLASNGMHTNGYTLARKVLFDQGGLKLESPLEQEAGAAATIGDELLRVHRPYVKAIHRLFGSINVKGLIHVTGGGLWDNIPRVLPPNLGARIDSGSWEVPAIFRLIGELGEIGEREMYHVFNMGIGMIVVISEDDTEKTLESLQASGEAACRIGHVDVGTPPVALVK
jgi:phosphoribosylformylglycinamidine cyclo-ligase